MFHPSYLVFFSSLLFSVIFSLSSNSFFIAWIGIEINLVAFIPLALSKSKHSLESVLKYFLIQRIASILIIITFNWNIYDSKIITILLLATLVIKIGVPPLHQWLAPVAEGLSWSIFYILITVQKVIPFYIIISLISSHEVKNIIVLLTIISALVGAVGGLSQTSVRKIITYSSISHISWIITALLLSRLNWLIYFLFYWVILAPIVIIFQKAQLSSLNDLIINKKISGLLIALNFLSLGGLPPFSGFIPKLIIVQSAINTQFSILVLPLLIATYMSLFFYIRLVSSIITISTSLNYSFKVHPPLTNTLLLFNITVLIGPTLIFTLLLNFKLKKLKAFKALIKEYLKFNEL